MKTNVRIDAEAIGNLIQMANDWMYARLEKETFLRSHDLPLRGDDYAFFCEKNERESCMWYALCATCRILGFDTGKVVGMAKAMRRYEERERWMVCAHIPSGWSSGCLEDGEERVIRFLKEV